MIKSRSKLLSGGFCMKRQTYPTMVVVTYVIKNGKFPVFYNVGYSFIWEFTITDLKAGG